MDIGQFFLLAWKSCSTLATVAVLVASAACGTVSPGIGFPVEPLASASSGSVAPTTDFREIRPRLLQEERLARSHRNSLDIGHLSTPVYAAAMPLAKWPRTISQVFPGALSSAVSALDPVR